MSPADASAHLLQPHRQALSAAAADDDADDDDDSGDGDGDDGDPIGRLVVAEYLTLCLSEPTSSARCFSLLQPLPCSAASPASSRLSRSSGKTDVMVMVMMVIMMTVIEKIMAAMATV